MYRKKEGTKNDVSTTVYSPCPENDKDSTLCIPDASGFSTWLKSSDDDEEYSKQLHSELEHIMDKLNCMLESSFSLNKEN